MRMAVCKQAVEVDGRAYAKGELVRWDVTNVKRGGEVPMVYVDRLVADGGPSMMDEPQFVSSFAEVPEHIRTRMAESFVALVRKYRAADPAIAQWLGEYDEALLESAGVRADRPEMN